MPAAGEAFLERWSRRKSEARTGAGDAEEDETSSNAPAAGSAAPPDGSGSGTPQDGPLPLPDLDSLDQDSDYSAFLAPGVDDGLRRQALRKLFQSPKFNVLDGLDDYMGDYTTFEPLGSLVTADMRYQLERAAKRLAEAIDAPDAPDQVAAGSPATPAVAAASPADGTDTDTTTDTNTDTNTGATPDDGKPPAA